MSKEVDQRVVEMRFDNKQFEENVKTSMSTLDKLKNALKFSDSSKGLENIGKAAKNVDMSGLSGAVETINSKFSALEVIGVTALANITNSAVNAGKKIVKSLSIDNIAAGFDKYTMETGNVQTLVNSTGKSVEEIEGYLKKLMWYSDETSYGFTDMTGALATMASSGGDIEKLIPLIEGVANATSFAGKGAAEFSRIMQFSVNQAYSSGSMKVQDWNTIAGATVNSKQLQETLISAAEQLGKIEKGSITVANFRDTLKDGWLDKDVMEAGFGAFAKVTEAAYEGVQNGTFENYADAMDKIGTTYGDVALKAARAGQESKSFSEVMSSIQDGVSSQWSQIFKSIFGNYEQAKELWSGLWEYLYEIFQKPMEKVRETIQETMSFSPYAQLMKKLEKVSDSIKAVTDKVKDYDAVVTKIINGDFGNGQARWNKLSEAGYDWAHAQNLVNERLGCSVRYATNYVAVQEDVTKQYEELTDAQLKELDLTDEEIKMYRSLEEQSKKTGKSIGELVDEMSQNDGRSLLIGGFKNIGDSILGIVESINSAWSKVFSFDAVKLYGVIKAFNDFTKKLTLSNKASEKLVTTFKGLFDTLDLILKVAKAPFTILISLIKETAKNLDISILDVTAKVGELLSRFHDWVLENSFIAKGIKGISKVLATCIRYVSKWINALLKSKTAKKVVKTLFEVFKVTGLVVVEIIKELYKFTEKWIGKLKETSIYKSAISGIKDAYEFLGEKISWVTDKTYEWTQELRVAVKEHEVLQKIADAFSTIGTWVGKATSATWRWVNSVLGSETCKKILSWMADTFKTIGVHVVDLAKATWDWIKAITESDAFKNMLEFIVDVFKKAVDIGTNIIDGLRNGLSDGSGGIIGFVRTIAENILKAAKEVLGIHSPSTKFYEIGMNCMKGFINGVKDFFSGVFDTVTNGFDALITFIDDIDWAKVFSLGLSIAIMSAGKQIFDILGTIARGFENFSKPAASIANFMNTITASIKDFGKAAKTAAQAEFVKSFAKSILILAVSILLLAQVEDEKKLDHAVHLIGLMTLVMAAFLTLAKFLTPKIESLGKLKDSITSIASIIGVIIGVSAVFLVLAGILRVLEKIDPSRVDQVIVLFTLITVAMMLLMPLIAVVSENVKDNQMKSLISALLKLSVAVGILAIVCVALSKMETDEMWRAGGALVALVSFVAGLAIIVNIYKGKADAIGTILLKIAGAIGILAIVAKMISLMTWPEMEKAAAGLAGLGLIVWGLMEAVKLSGGTRKVSVIGDVLIKIAVCMAILAVTVKIISDMTWPDMGKAAVGLAGLLAVVWLLLVIVKKVGGVEGAKNIGLTLLGVAMVIGVLAACCVILGLVDTGVLAQGVLAVSVLTVMMSLLIKALKGANECRYAISAMTAVIVAIAASALVLSFLDPAKLAQGVGAVAILLAMLALVLSKTKNVTEKALGPLIVVAVIIAILGGVVALLSLLPDPNAAMKSAGALAMLMVVCAGLLYVSKSIAKDAADACKGALVLLVLMAPVLALASMLLMLKDVNNAIENAVVLTILIVATTLIAVVLSMIGKHINDAYPGIVALTAMAIPLLAFAFVLGRMSDVNNAIANAAALAILATTCTLLLIPLMLIASLIVGTGGIGAIGLVAAIVALAAMAIPLLAFVGVLALMEGLQNAQTNAEVLCTLLTTITSALVTIGLVAPLLLIAEVALVGFIAVIGLFAALVIGVAALTTLFPGLEEFLGKGIDLLVKLADGLGRVVGSFINGALTAAVSGLPEIGAQLSAFMINATPFILGAKMIDDSVTDGIKNLASAMLKLTGAKLFNQLTKWITGGSSLADFGLQIAAFGPAMATFNESVKDVNGENIKNAADAGKKLAKMANEISKIGGLTGKLFGKTDMEAFGTKLESFGESLKTYYTSIADIKVKTLSGVNEQVVKLVEIAKSITSVKIDNVSEFGKALEKLGKDGITLFKNAFVNSNKEITDAVNGFISNFTNAISSNANISRVRLASLSLVNGSLNAIKTKTNYDSFYSAGYYLAEGFGNGINAGRDRLSKISLMLAAATCTAIKKALDIRSPSRVMYGLGEYTGQGFVNALRDYCDVAGEAGYDMAESASDGLNRAISTVKDFVDGKISDQPTIRPVLDLTDVESGARRINGLFSARQAVELASAGTIGIQNGGSGCVINMTVNGAPGQDVNQLADLVSERINNSIRRRNNTWR